MQAAVHNWVSSIEDHFNLKNNKPFLKRSPDKLGVKKKYAINVKEIYKFRLMWKIHINIVKAN